MKKKMTAKLEISRSFQNLVQLGMCSTSDIREANSSAEKLSTPESQRKIRESERLFGIVGRRK